MDFPVLPSSDSFVLYLFGDESNVDLLLSFINAVHIDYDFPLIQSVTIKNPFSLKEFYSEKEIITDVKAVDENGKLYDIEIQSSSSIHFKKRSLYYWAQILQI